jgi:hypothetical protein
MELQEIDVYIDENGEVRIEVRGVKGTSCLEVTKALEAALGGEVKAREKTAEMYESPQAQSAQQWNRQS